MWSIFLFVRFLYHYLVPRPYTEPRYCPCPYRAPDFRYPALPCRGTGRPCPWGPARHWPKVIGPFGAAAQKGTDQPTDRPTDQPTDGRTKRGIESRSTRLKNMKVLIFVMCVSRYIKVNVMCVFHFVFLLFFSSAFSTSVSWEFGDTASRQLNAML